MNNDEFKNLPASKFKLVNENKKLHDKELVTKPIGFFKDAMYRFSRNKGSIFGAIVIGVLVLYAIIAPIISPYTVSYNDGYFRFTLPKLFSSEKIDFLDGCAQKTLNENTFLYYYSMGQETGHNAIKRQEYRKNAKGMYTFRLDSYQKNGCIFLTGITQENYEALQDYQDKTGRQIIYPVTDPAKRPEQSQDKGNANYWFETRTEGSITVPDNYVINEDGSVQFTDIYTTYYNQNFASSKVLESKNMPAIVKVSEAGEGKFNLFLSYDFSEFDKDGNLISEKYIDEGYLCLDRRLDEDFFYFDEDKANACAFSYVTNISGLGEKKYSTITFEANGHEDATKDGTYYLALPAIQGSTVSIKNFANIEADLTNEDDSLRVLPLSFIDSNRNFPETIDLTKNYGLGIIRESGSIVNSYLKSLVKKTEGANDNIAIDKAASSAAKISFAGNESEGYTVRVSSAKVPVNLVVRIDDNDVPYFDIGTVQEANKWFFDDDNSAIYTNLTGFKDAKKNGTYYIVNRIQATIEKNQTVYTSTIGFAKVEEIVSERLNDFYHLVSTSNAFVESIDTTATYRFRASTDLTSKDALVIDGSFKGDDYRSNLRVEGKNNYKYSYAIPKTGHTYEIRVNYYEYFCYYHRAILKDRIASPFFLFGTTSYGQDIFTCLASGARFSFMMAIIVAIVNMIVGAIFGAIEGYYGGKVDLIMERVVEILSAVPFMIVITLLKYHMHGSSHVLILFIAFFLTGWIGMSGTVRMQFYRFKNQEYVLASRTLGARDWRIMFRHIFPNALGTIVTSSVLVIPGMIFSETSLSYLGIINLNTGNTTSVGTLLANAQPYLVTYPHMILFPAIFISALMLCFNLFGNGLRDAFNPSLRGTED